MSATITILSVSPHDEDHGVLEEIFRQHSLTSRDEDGNWKVYRSPDLQWATVMLRLHEIPVAICERDLPPGNWQELFERTLQMPHAPLVIVTSRLADERMWAEVLNLGGWDVLAKPFDGTEVIRVVESAWRRWQAQCGSAASALCMHRISA